MSRKRKTGSWPETRSAGFSFVELLGIMALVAILVAIGYPRLAALSPIYRLEGATRNLAAELQRARFRAIAEGVRFQVVFDGAAKTYQIQKETSPGTFVDDEGVKAIEDSNSVAIAATANPIFSTRGAAQVTAVVTLTASNGAVRLVAVGAPGRVYVQ